MILLLLSACYYQKPLSTRLSQNFFCRQASVFFEQKRAYSFGAFSQTRIKLGVYTNDPGNDFWKAYAESLVVEKSALLQKLGVNTGYLNLANVYAPKGMNKGGAEVNTVESVGLISRIVEAADPLYPITPQEVEQILNIYKSLPERPPAGITNVLKGHVKTAKSSIYCAVMKYIADNNLTLDGCKQVYAKISKSLKGNALDEMKKFMSETKNTIAINKLESPSEEDEKTLRTPDGKYDITANERKLLNSLYKETAGIDLKYVVRVLRSRAKMIDRGVTNKGISDAIETIKEQNPEIADKLDINYFRKLYWLSIKVTGENGNLDHNRKGSDKRPNDEENVSSKTVADKKHKKHAKIISINKKTSIKRRR